MKLILSLFTAFLGLASISSALNLIETAEQGGNFTQLVDLAQQTGQEDLLGAGGPFTVFAPTDEAFAAALGNLTDEQMGIVQANLAGILGGHVVTGNYSSATIADGSTAGEVTTLGQVPITIASDGTTVTVSDGTITATVIMADIVTDNGIIHAIDGVLIPEGVRLQLAGGSAVPGSGVPAETSTPEDDATAPPDTMGPDDEDTPTASPVSGGGSPTGGGGSGTTEAPTTASTANRTTGHLVASAILFFAGLIVM